MTQSIPRAATSAPGDANASPFAFDEHIRVNLRITKSKRTTIVECQIKLTTSNERTAAQTEQKGLEINVHK